MIVSLFIQSAAQELQRRYIGLPCLLQIPLQQHIKVANDKGAKDVVKKVRDVLEAQCDERFAINCLKLDQPLLCKASG